MAEEHPRTFPRPDQHFGSRPLPRMVSFGEALTDMIREDDERWLAMPGGAAWNVARALRALGLPATFAGAISRDALGDQLFDAGQVTGLDPRYIQRVQRSPLLAMVYQRTPPQYFFIGEDSADLYFDPRLLPAGWQAVLEWSHFGGISLTREPLAQRLVELAATLKAQDKCISFDPNFRNLMDSRYDRTLERMCRLADVIKVSEEDLVGLFRHPDPRHGLARIRDWAPDAWLLLTNGAQVATLFRGSQSWAATPPCIEVVGAGDVAMAGLIRSLCSATAHTRPEDNLRFAVAAGTAACLSAGATPPTLDTVVALLTYVTGVSTVD